MAEIVSLQLVALKTCMSVRIRNSFLLHFVVPGIVPIVIKGCCTCAGPGVNSQTGEKVAK